MKIHEFLEQGGSVRVEFSAPDTRSNEIKITGFAKGKLGQTHYSTFIPKKTLHLHRDIELLRTGQEVLYYAINHYMESEEKERERKHGPPN